MKDYFEENGIPKETPSHLIPSPTGRHLDITPIDDMDESQLAALRAQRVYQKEEDKPYREYLNGLIENLIIADERKFDEFTERSMQSNELIHEFVYGLIDKLSNKINQFRLVDPNNKDEIHKIKLEIESIFYVYEKYLYNLKRNGWRFQQIGFDVPSLSIPSEIKDKMRSIENNYDLCFEFMIPGDLGNDYGRPFERKGRMLPGETLFYEYLKGKEVNWHQVLIYRENELTPYQRFLENQAKKAGAKR